MRQPRPRMLKAVLESVSVRSHCQGVRSLVQRGGLGASLSSVDTLHGRLLALKRTLGPDPPPLYFVKVDVRACFDTIKQGHLRDLVASMLQDVRQLTAWGRLRFAGSLGDRALHADRPSHKRRASQPLPNRGSSKRRAALLRPARGAGCQPLPQLGPRRSSPAADDQRQGLLRHRAFGHR